MLRERANEGERIVAVANPSLHKEDLSYPSGSDVKPEDEWADHGDKEVGCAATNGRLEESSDNNVVKNTVGKVEDNVERDSRVQRWSGNG